MGSERQAREFFGVVCMVTLMTLGVLWMLGRWWHHGFWSCLWLSGPAGLWAAVRFDRLGRACG